MISVIVSNAKWFQLTHQKQKFALTDIHLKVCDCRLSN